MVEVGGRGGVTDYTADLVAAIAAAGWNVTLASATDATYDVPGVRVVRMFHYFRRGSSRFRRRRSARCVSGQCLNGLAVLAALPRLTRLARRAQVVHSQGEEWPPLGVAMMARAAAARRPVVYTAHNTFDRVGSHHRSRGPIYRLATSVIVHTQADADALPASVRSRAVVIAHGEYGGLAARAGAPPTAAGRARRARAARGRHGRAAVRPTARRQGDRRSARGAARRSRGPCDRRRGR